MVYNRNRQSRKEIKRGGGAPHCSHHCSGISPLQCDGQTLPQVGERLGSPVTCLRRQPSSLKNMKVSGPKVPAVSMAISVKCWLRAIYFSCLLRSPRAATAPASLVALGRWERANVSGQVVSHTRSLPLFQGTSVTPSGRLPSEQERPVSCCTSVQMGKHPQLLVTVLLKVSCFLHDITRGTVRPS